MQAIRRGDRFTDDGGDRFRPLEDDLLLHPLGTHDIAGFAFQVKVIAVVIG